MPSNFSSSINRTGNKIPSGYKSGRLQQFTPDQMQLFQQMFQNLQPESYLSKLAGGDKTQFDQMEAPALRQFGEIQGNIASRFSGMGMGARRSSGFQNTMNQAASNFAQDLQSRRQLLQQQAIKDLMGLGNDLLGQRPYDNFLVPKSGGFLNSLGGGIGGAIPGAISGFMAGGPAGAAIGGVAGAAGGALGANKR